MKQITHSTGEQTNRQTSMTQDGWLPWWLPYALKKLLDHQSSKGWKKFPASSLEKAGIWQSNDWAIDWLSIASSTQKKTHMASWSVWIVEEKNLWMKLSSHSPPAHGLILRWFNSCVCLLTPFFDTPMQSRKGWLDGFLLLIRLN